MVTGIDIMVRWFDVHVLELTVRAGNNKVFATTEIYADLDTPAYIAQSIRGFPRNARDERELLLGASCAGEFGGGVHLNFYCLDAVGHAAVVVRMRTDGTQSSCGRPETAEFAVPIEAAGLDSFVLELEAMPLEVGAIAHLPAAMRLTATSVAEGVRLGFDESEFDAAQRRLLELSKSLDPYVRGNAIGGFGQLARRFLRLDDAARPVVELAAVDSNEFVRGKALDAISDIEQFLGWSFEGRSVWPSVVLPQGTGIVVRSWALTRLGLTRRRLLDAVGVDEPLGESRELLSLEFCSTEIHERLKSLEDLGLEQHTDFEVVSLKRPDWLVLTAREQGA